MAPPGRVNTPPSITPSSIAFVRGAACVGAAIPAGWLAALLARLAAAVRLRLAPVVAAMVVAFAWAAVRGPPDWPLLTISLGLGWCLIGLAAVDLAAFRLPDSFTLPLLAAGLVVASLLPERPVVDHLVGAGLGWGGLAALAWAWRRWRGVDGIGLGDAKLLGAAGAWLGWSALPSVLLIACGVAFVWVGARVARGGALASRQRIAFGAPLCLAIWAVWLEGPLVV